MVIGEIADRPVWWSGPMDAEDLARRFGLGRPVRLSDGPVARGRQGVVWRLDTADGSWAVKVPLFETSEDGAREGAAFQEAAYAAGVPTPRVVRTTDGRVLATVGDRTVRLYEWVDLLPADPGLDPVRVGEVAAAIHRVRIPTTGTMHPWYRDPVGAEAWDRLIAQLTEAGAPFAGRLAGLRDELVALESWLEPPAEVWLCHCDLWADNLLPVAGGGLCVIDWENSGPCDPAQELACLLFEFGRTDPGRARALIGAYRTAGGPATVSRRGHFSMLIAQLGHIAELAAKDWLQPNPRSPRRADAEEWIGEMFDDPHTRERLDALLATVRD
jgi:Ser/Thr protein kinase RdoA (MazF antagonist)